MPDESVLENPSEHTVEEVVAALDEASPEEVMAAQQREGQGRARKGIMEYRDASAPPDDGQERYDVTGWRERARGHLGVSPHVVAGALHDLSPGERLTRDEVRQRVDDFLGREVEA